MQFASKLAAASAVAVATTVVTAMPALADGADGADVPNLVRTTVAGHGWTTHVENAGLGRVSMADDDGAPYPGEAALLETGPGDAAAGKGGKPYLFNSSYADVKVAEITDLGYSTKVTATPQAELAPALNLSVVSTDPATPADLDWQGTLVYEPIYQSQDATTGSWQNWDATADDAQWWFTRDVVAADGSVVIPKQQTQSMDAFLAAFDDNPKYSDLRLDPRGAGLQVSLGQAGYNAGTSDITALVDGVTFGTSEGATTYDFAEGIGSCVAEVDGSTYTLTEDCDTFSTLEFPDGATLDGDGHTITAVEDATHANFPGPVVKSATGTDSAAASLQIRDLTIDTDFQGSNSGGKLAGIEMLRAGGSLTHVTVNGITHGNGVQEGNAISIRNRVSGDNIDVPRAHVSLNTVTVTNYQKTGVLLDGNLSFTAKKLNVGAAGTPAGEPMAAGVIAANSVQISRGAAGSLTHSTIANNHYDGETATAVLLYNARNVELAKNTITGSGDTGVYASNSTNTMTTGLDIDCMVVENTAEVPAETSVGLYLDQDGSTAGSLKPTVTDTLVRGWGQNVIGAEMTDGPGTCGVVTRAVKGHATVVKVNRRVRVDMFASALPDGAVEGKKLTWRITVDNRRVFGITQHADRQARWVRTFPKNSGLRTVKVFKNGVLAKTVKVRTKA
jgi:hypothetical protein